MLPSKLASACARAIVGVMLVGGVGIAADVQARSKPIKPPVSHSESREQDSRVFVPVVSPLAAFPGLPS
ncbi:MAG TPA: alpha/beta hydrolase, partial [Pseudomonas sp.]|nr:alpha/beta hydrolase [Pseudomonas sp.]